MRVFSRVRKRFPSPRRRMIIYIPEKDTDVEAELAGCYNCTIFMCQICCNDCDYWRWLLGLHGGEYATVHNCLGLIGAYALWTWGRCCLSIDGDFRRSVIGASGLKLGPSGRGRSQSGRDFGMVEGGSGWKGLQGGGWLWEGQMWRRIDFEKVGCGGRWLGES